MGPRAETRAHDSRRKITESLNGTSNTMKTAKQLKLTNAELTALKAVRSGLLRGEYVHAPNPDEMTPVSRRRLFNMNYDSETAFRCGTVCCIGGWMAKEMPTKEMFSIWDAEEKPIGRLFFPGVGVDEWDAITPRQAARAISNFLKTGFPRWREVVRNRRA